MELKDVILSTIAELGEEPEEKPAPRTADPVPAPKEEPTVSAAPVSAPAPTSEDAESLEAFKAEQRAFLERLRERLLVLFDGFQSPNNVEVAAKIDLTLNFLEYLLATLDERIDALKKP
jgi:hypothetical protein